MALIDFEQLSMFGDELEDNYNVDSDVEPIVKRGDIWRLGNHRLMCGDSTSAAAVARLMDGVVADMAFTDPPYGYEYQSNRRTKTNKFDVLANDDKTLDFFPNMFMRVNGFVMVCTTWKVMDVWMPLFKRYYDLTNVIIWNKGGGGTGDLLHTFSTDYEIILCASNGATINGKRIGSVWNIKRDNANFYAHPTQKPVRLAAMAIEHTTKRGNIVLDLFGGSGSTMMACEQLGRACYMMEYEPHYCDVIINRWRAMTGKTAERIG